MLSRQQDQFEKPHESGLFSNSCALPFLSCCRNEEEPTLDRPAIFKILAKLSLGRKTACGKMAREHGIGILVSNKLLRCRIELQDTPQQPVGNVAQMVQRRRLHRTIQNRFVSLANRLNEVPEMIQGLLSRRSSSFFCPRYVSYFEYPLDHHIPFRSVEDVPHRRSVLRIRAPRPNFEFNDLLLLRVDAGR